MICLLFYPMFLFAFNVLFDNFSSPLLLISCVTCMQKMVGHLGDFLSPYLHRVLLIYCELITNAVHHHQLESIRPHLEHRLSSLRKQIERCPLRTSFYAYRSAFDAILQEVRNGFTLSFYQCRYIVFDYVAVPFLGLSQIGHFIWVVR